MPDLTSFLLARIAEDEAVARERDQFSHKPLYWWLESMPPVLVMEPARVLAECEAKRRIVDRGDARP